MATPSSLGIALLHSYITVAKVVNLSHSKTCHLCCLCKRSQSGSAICKLQSLLSLGHHPYFTPPWLTSEHQLWNELALFLDVIHLNHPQRWVFSYIGAHLSFREKIEVHPKDFTMRQSKSMIIYNKSILIQNYFSEKYSTSVRLYS